MSDKAKVEALLYKYGYRLKRCKKHQVWENARHEQLVISATPSDWRSYANMLASLKRQVAGLPISQHAPKLVLTEAESSGFDRSLGKSPRRPVPISRPAKSKGTGFIYDDPKVVELTPEQVEEREKRRAEKRARRKENRAYRVRRKQHREGVVSTLKNLMVNALLLMDRRDAPLNALLDEWRSHKTFWEFRNEGDYQDFVYVQMARQHLVDALRFGRENCKQMGKPFTLAVEDQAIELFVEYRAEAEREKKSAIELVLKSLPVAAELVMRSKAGINELKTEVTAYFHRKAEASRHGPLRGITNRQNDIYLTMALLLENGEVTFRDSEQPEERADET